MSQSPSPPPKGFNLRRRFVLVASQYNAKYVQGLITHCTAELRALSANATVSLRRVPGAFEIPLVVQKIAQKQAVDAIIALGVILEGQTAHAQFLGNVVTHSLQQIALQHGVPVIHAVLSLKNEAQARKRCLGNKINRGTEAARVAFEMANIMARIRR
ncbi:MAG TPA: 6,7-dimethyl-8-ribityllumazine synthase [Chthoniobacterales bacterium]|jgi:6,7-dimethyl-8-ribityllumazine synthase